MLQGKVILVTGGLGFLGKALVNALCEQQAKVVIGDIQPQADLTEVFPKWVDSIGYCQMDITKKHSIEAAIDSVVSQFGQLDGVVSNAYPRNKNYGRKFFDVEFDDFCDNVNMHLGGYFLVAQVFAKFFAEQGHGKIVNMSSIYGVNAPRFDVYDNTPMTMPVEYAAIKSGVVHLTKYIAAYLRGKNVQVNAVSPGGLLDGQPQDFVEKYNQYAINKGMLDPQDITGAVCFLLSSAADYVNGQNIVVDDGWSL